MKILLTGANGYIGRRMLTVLAESGHHVIALVRSPRRIAIPAHLESHVTIIKGDLLQLESLGDIPKDVEAAYYLVHSMGQRASGFSTLEGTCAENFNQAVAQTNIKQVIYLSGLAKSSPSSEHMCSRHHVEDVLRQGSAALTVLRAGIIIGSGSASFEIMRDLVEKLPVMVAPKWVHSRCQPIGIVDVLRCLVQVLGQEKYFDQSYDIGGPEVLTYKEMLLRFAKIRGLRRLIITVPVLTPYLSSLWLFFITSTNFSIARALVNSLKIDAICTHKNLDVKCMDFETAIKRAFAKIEQNSVVSSWKDAMVQSELKPVLAEYIQVPVHGCLSETHTMSASVKREEVLDRLFSIGGENGWYYMNWAWSLRGVIDQLFGGVGLRRGRRDPLDLVNGDALDFWRVLVADRKEGHLLLFAEMLVPGEAWLEWRVSEAKGITSITQTATFRPKGLLGRAYWYSLVPLHAFIFRGICKKILRGFDV